MKWYYRRCAFVAFIYAFNRFFAHFQLRKENSTLLDVQTERDKLRQTCESLTDSSKQLTSEYAHVSELQYVTPLGIFVLVNGAFQLKEKADKLCSVESEREGLKQHLTEVSAELESSKNELNCLKTEVIHAY